jgi:pimeloyl-ACP methyl ester carboxylesterase
MIEASIKRPGGRTLTYAQYGNQTGKPVFFFQGTPSCRLLHPDEDVTRELGANLIVIDRPGFGRSDFQPGRRLLDWPDDVCAVADALGIGRFATAGISGGGPYVLACAYQIAERLTATAVVSGGGPADAPGALQGMAPERRTGYFIATRLPWLMLPVMWLARNPRRNVDKFYARYTADMSPPDRAFLDRPEFAAMMKRNYSEATQAGLRGFAHEVMIVTRAWGFRLEDVRAPVHLWHGDCDTSTPIGMARAIAAAIPGCRATFFPGEGHFLLFAHWREILQDLLAG